MLAELQHKLSPPAALLPLPSYHRASSEVKSTFSAPAPLQWVLCCAWPFSTSGQLWSKLERACYPALATAAPPSSCPCPGEAGDQMSASGGPWKDAPNTFYIKELVYPAASPPLPPYPCEEASQKPILTLRGLPMPTATCVWSRKGWH